MNHWLSSMSDTSVAAHTRVRIKWLCHGHLRHGQVDRRRKFVMVG